MEATSTGLREGVIGGVITVIDIILGCNFMIEIIIVNKEIF